MVYSVPKAFATLAAICMVQGTVLLFVPALQDLGRGAALQQVRAVLQGGLLRGEPDSAALHLFSRRWLSPARKDAHHRTGMRKKNL